jgi:hypothetical protein
MKWICFPLRWTQEGNCKSYVRCKKRVNIFSSVSRGIFGGIGDRGVFRTIRLSNDGDVTNALRTKRSEIKSWGLASHRESPKERPLNAGLRAEAAASDAAAV